MSLRSLIISAICLLLVFHTPIFCFSQDTTWTAVSIPSGVSIDMFEPIHEYDTVQMKVFTSQGDHYALQVKYLKSGLHSRNGDEVVENYEKFLKGFLNSSVFSLYANIVSDTSFAGTDGRWIHSTYGKDNEFREMFNYIVLANGHFYVMTFISDHPISQTTLPILSRFFSSLKFLNQPVLEYSGDFRLQEESYRMGERFGLFLPKFLTICAGVLILILICVKIIRKKRPGKT